MKKENKSLVILKPDAVRRGLIGQILSRFEKRGFVFNEIKLTTFTEDKMKKHYDHLSDRPELFTNIIKYMTSGPSLVVSVSHSDETIDTISAVRQMVGATNPIEATPGTIRADFAVNISENVIHASDSILGSNIEHKLHFD